MPKAAYVWPAADGPFEITVTLGRHGARHECVGLSVRLVGRPTDPDGFPVIIRALDMRKIPFGQFVDRAYHDLLVLGKRTSIVDTTTSSVSAPRDRSSLDLI